MKRLAKKNMPDPLKVSAALSVIHFRVPCVVIESLIELERPVRKPVSRSSGKTTLDLRGNSLILALTTWQALYPEKREIARST